MDLNGCGWMTSGDHQAIINSIFQFQYFFINGFGDLGFGNNGYCTCPVDARLLLRISNICLCKQSIIQSLLQLFIILMGRGRGRERCRVALYIYISAIDFFIFILFYYFIRRVVECNILFCRYILRYLFHNLFHVVPDLPINMYVPIHIHNLYILIGLKVNIVNIYINIGRIGNICWYLEVIEINQLPLRRILNTNQLIKNLF
ncbi:hypothetical protein ACJX0J_030732 [Zea mays]